MAQVVVNLRNEADQLQHRMVIRSEHLSHPDLMDRIQRALEVTKYSIESVDEAGRTRHWAPGRVRR
jgi:hypothetical protein